VKSPACQQEQLVLLLLLLMHSTNTVAELGQLNRPT
jgi:hypothetical protein